MEFDIQKFELPDNTACHDSPITVPVLDAKCLSYSDFFDNFMQKNVPCLIKNISNNWEATKKWISNGKPNLDYLNEKYKHTKVIIYNCSERYFNSQKCREGTLAEYVDLWKENRSGTLYYLKDWHLKLQSRNDNFYEVPIYFGSDWLNEFFTQCLDDDYRFVYMGQKGTWTPLHADVFNSYSWSVNVCGQKKWILFPPGEEQCLKDELNNIPYDIGNMLSSHPTNSAEVIQNPGEAVFVPSGWYHQVWNLDDTISVNHNWVNGCNINMMWESLKHNLEAVKKEIENCQEMDNFKEHCQTMLKALFGIDYKQFYDFLEFIGKSRLDMVNDQTSRKLFHGHSIGVNHIMFDLHQVHKVLESFLNCGDVSETTYYSNGQSLLDEIVHILKSGNILYP